MLSNENRGRLVSNILLAVIAVLLLVLCVLLGMIHLEFKSVKTDTVLNPDKATEALKSMLPTMTGANIFSLTQHVIREVSTSKRWLKDLETFLTGMGCSSTNECSTEVFLPDGTAGFFNQMAAIAGMVANALPATPRSMPAPVAEETNWLGLSQMWDWMKAQGSFSSWKPVAQDAKTFIDQDLMNAQYMIPAHLKKECRMVPDDSNSYYYSYREICTWEQHGAEDHTLDVRDELRKVSNFLGNFIAEIPKRRNPEPTIANITR